MIYFNAIVTRLFPVFEFYRFIYVKLSMSKRGNIPEKVGSNTTVCRPRAEEGTGVAIECIQRRQYSVEMQLSSH